MMKSLMKAGMLCLVLIATSIAQGAEKIDFNSQIQSAEAESQAAHSEALKRQPASDTISFYYNDWLSLRKRKRLAIARADVRLKLRPSRNSVKPSN